MGFFGLGFLVVFWVFVLVFFVGLFFFFGGWVGSVSSPSKDFMEVLTKLLSATD